MVEIKNTETDNRIIASKLSVAILAWNGNMADYISTKVLLVKDKEGKLGPPAGKIEVLDGVPENPLVAIQREWREETDGEPFVFENAPNFKNCIFAQRDGFTDIGFIFHARLTDESTDLFIKGKTINTDEKIVEAKLYNIDNILEILRDWKSRLVHPEINAQTLINVVNNVMINHDSLFMPGTKIRLFELKNFEMDFKITVL
jgi:hypothetical protein